MKRKRNLPTRGKEINVIIDGKKYVAEKGQKIIDICRKNKILLPTLCNHADFDASDTVCRLCLVKVKDQKNKISRLLPSCSLKAEGDMEVFTTDNDITRIRKTILELLFVEHAGLCSSCFRNLNCELQSLAIRYGIDQFRFVGRPMEIDSEEDLERLGEKLSRRVIDRGNPSIARDSSKCIECRRCVKTCEEIQGISAYSIQKRGHNMGIGTENYTPLECSYCGQCAIHCPTAAIIEKSELVSVIKALKDPKKTVVAQIAPSVKVTLGEEFGMFPGTIVQGQAISALRQCGFDFVFNVNTGADLTVTEESCELLERIKNDSPKPSLPLFTSCCPAWVLFCEEYYPQLIPHLSTTRSPQMMTGSLIKNYYANKAKISPKDIVVVSIMPCTAKKYEAARPEYASKGIRDVDYVLTTRELAHLIKSLKIKFDELKEDSFDSPLGVSTGAAEIFGSSGGLTEAIIRTTYFFATGKNLAKPDLPEIRGSDSVRETEIKINRRKIRIAVVSGLKEAKKIAESIIKKECNYDFIEVMACPGGCIGGGGQPYPINDQIRRSRKNSLYELDRKSDIREAHKSSVIKKLYRNFLYEPGSRKALRLLHTKHYPYVFPLRKKHMKQ